MLNQTRWNDLIANICQKSQQKNYFSDIISAYSQPHRQYHHAGHIEHCLCEFDTACNLANHPNEVELAIWLHDIVYNPMVHNNEKQSAQWASSMLIALKCKASVIQRVYNLIMATKHHSTVRDADTQLLIDIDLSILGQPADDYDIYEKAVRIEYKEVPQIAYCMGRKKVLKTFLAKDRIFQTDLFFEKYENRAKQNLSRAINALSLKKNINILDSTRD